jgi:hypothetical protein
MRFNFSEITPHHKKMVKPIFESMSDLFPWWVDRVNIYYDEDNVGGASASPYKPYRRVAIHLSRELLSEPEAKIRRYIAHEIAHSYNEGLLRVIFNYVPKLSLEDDTKKIFNQICLDAIEEQTEDLSVLFDRRM